MCSSVAAATLGPGKMLSAYSMRSELNCLKKWRCGMGSRKEIKIVSPLLEMCACERERIFS